MPSDLPAQHSPLQEQITIEDLTALLLAALRRWHDTSDDPEEVRIWIQPADRSDPGHEFTRRVAYRSGVEAAARIVRDLLAPASPPAYAITGATAPSTASTAAA